MKDNENKLIGSLMSFAMRTAQELQTEVPRRYGLDFEDYKSEVLLACVHLGREWKPRTPSEGRMDEDETSKRTYCWRLAKVRARSQIERKYGKNLKHLRMSLSNDFKDWNGASAVDAVSFDDDARTDVEKMVEEIRSISNPFEVKMIDLLLKGKTYREIAVEMRLPYH